MIEYEPNLHYLLYEAIRLGFYYISVSNAENCIVDIFVEQLLEFDEGKTKVAEEAEAKESKKVE